MQSPRLLTYWKSVDPCVCSARLNYLLNGSSGLFIIRDTGSSEVGSLVQLAPYIHSMLFITQLCNYSNCVVTTPTYIWTSLDPPRVCAALASSTTLDGLFTLWDAGSVPRWLRLKVSQYVSTKFMGWVQVIVWSTKWCALLATVCDVEPGSCC